MAIVITQDMYAYQKQKTIQWFTPPYILATNSQPNKHQYRQGLSVYFESQEEETPHT